MMTTMELQESIEVCVGYLCARLEEIEAAVKDGRLRLTETGVKAFLDVGRNLNAVAENIAWSGPQDVVVQFTDSESKPQNLGDTGCGLDT